MNAIVIVFMPASDTQPLSRQTAERLLVELLPASAGFPATLESDQATPPLWTWFVQNPRRCGT